ncbi:16S rRNA (guanine(966)-N(2))-methyltransferase RsmD [Fervidibacillus halotolerans]|uniref:16S rRNA (Guanine(966)-N(2))-methyltransferase RsmD n=1 Tax=Fervidibacillus halotolerans TaxID=2980027 RepID=A0A9E8M336_9BACI|nr:16S rRNA (guanine(966)-N(2))-methyltransferase RsmD [Fervidibacillus halotolerans]WAA13706.1 16S rRNA (guanine(966)-N(2))-methyltransferase RsmD [Fervidibacillus halotolerans]
MRVISGSKKGRLLKAVPGQNTRPTTDKVKESMFNIIGPYFDGGWGLDLFAGSGGLGIEGLSRGLEKVLFVDHHPKAIETIRSNLATCQLMDFAEVYKNDWRRALKIIIHRKIVFQVIWLDPPYKKIKHYHEILQMVNDYRLLENGGSLVCEHSSDMSLPDTYGLLNKMKTTRYGSIALSIYKMGSTSP